MLYRYFYILSIVKIVKNNYSLLILRTIDKKIFFTNTLIVVTYKYVYIKKYKYNIFVQYYVKGARASFDDETLVKLKRRTTAGFGSNGI